MVIRITKVSTVLFAWSHALPSTLGLRHWSFSYQQRLSTEGRILRSLTGGSYGPPEGWRLLLSPVCATAHSLKWCVCILRPIRAFVLVLFPSAAYNRRRSLRTLCVHYSPFLKLAHRYEAAHTVGCSQRAIHCSYGFRPFHRDVRRLVVVSRNGVCCKEAYGVHPFRGAIRRAHIVVRVHYRCVHALWRVSYR